MSEFFELAFLSCDTAQNISTFILIGRGSLLPTPIDLYSAIAPWEDWYIATPQKTDSADSSSHSNNERIEERTTREMGTTAEGRSLKVDTLPAKIQIPGII